ncbi:hypothetical protein E2C01_100065 [Portunus trituberculatus]|uniref:Uncharacterized protein n=1 Tax=Portunus trituberculatus TaxID=210409 RepID=A0A5B7KB28_PORTR|nr:hypothetical protein [Portunus trituberculatus]
MSAVTRFKQSVSHGKPGKECKVPISAIARLRSLRLGHTTLSAHLHRLRLSRDPFCPWCRTTPRQLNISCSNATLPLSSHCIALRPGHHNNRPAHPIEGLRRPPILATCCLLPYLCLLEEDRPLPRL